MARTRNFLLNSVVHAFRFHQGPEFLICRDWVRIAWHRSWRIAKCRKPGLRLKDFFRIRSNCNFEFPQKLHLGFSAWTIQWQCNKLSFEKSMTGFEWCNSHAKFLGGFLPVPRDLFDECKKYGQFKSGTSGYWLNSPVRLKEEKTQHASISLTCGLWKGMLKKSVSDRMKSSESKFIYASLINPWINQ